MSHRISWLGVIHYVKLPFRTGSNDAIDTIYHFLKDAKHPEELRKHCLGNNKSVLCLSKEISDDGSNFFFQRVVC